MTRPSNSLAWLTSVLLSVLGWWPVAAADDPPEEDQPATFSFVLFLKAPRPLTKQSLSTAITKAWKLEPATASKIKFTGGDGEWIVRHQGIDYSVESADTPWLDDQEDVIAESTDHRMRGMLRRVTSYVAITLENSFNSDDELDAAVASALKLLCELIRPEDTLAIYDDDTGDFNYIGPEVTESLLGDDPLGAFEAEVPPPAVVGDAKKPAFAPAEREAKRRWPEFSKAFRDHGAERGPFMIRASLGSEARPVHLWCEVSGISGGKISGVIKGNPDPQSKFAEGENVALPLASLTDWIYPDDEGERIGAFTLDLDAPPAEE